MEKIAAAVVGLGRIASLLEDDPLREKPCTHTGALTANPECRLTAGADTDETRRRLFAERWGCPVYASAEAMLKEQSPELLVIATHPDSHAHYCALAAELGVRVVICEKPLADSIEQARQITALRHITILTNHERRYSEDYIQGKAILDAGRLGRLLSVRAVLYMGAKRRLLDVLWHDGTHLADAIMFLSGSVMNHKKKRGPRLSTRQGTAYIMGCLGAEQIPFVIELGGKRDHLAFELEFSGERGRLRIGNGLFEVWESEDSPYAQGFKSLKKTADGFAGPTGYFANMLRDAVACVRDPARKPRSGAEDGLRVIEYLNAVQPWTDA